jgi:hypothetical protein
MRSDSLMVSAPSAVAKTYCVSCHSGQAPAGGLLLDQLDASPPSGDPDAWKRVVRQLRARTMPPVAARGPITIRTARITAGPLTDTELALRLAQLIWNGEPDQPLRDAAATSRLHDSQALQAVTEMLAVDDPLLRPRQSGQQLSSAVAKLLVVDHPSGVLPCQVVLR